MTEPGGPGASVGRPSASALRDLKAGRESLGLARLFPVHGAVSFSILVEVFPHDELEHGLVAQPPLAALLAQLLDQVVFQED